MTRTFTAILVNVLFAVIGLRARSMDLSGAACGAALGFIVYVSLDWQGYAMLATFVILGSAMTRFRYPQKQSLGGAQARGGRRSAAHALAKLSVGAACALLAASDEVVSPQLWMVAFVAAFATALADTTGTELGQLYGKRPVLLPSFRPVPIGTEGAVSLEGTLLALLCAALLAAEARLLGLIQPPHVPLIVIASGVGIMGESLLSRLSLNNQLLNFLHTLIGALVAATLYHLSVHFNCVGEN
jgi:uncharacterized protein (TIGR00297 family)